MSNSSYRNFQASRAQVSKPKPVLQEKCQCGNFVKRATSNSPKNPNRDFAACSTNKDKGGCGYFVWIDECVTENPKKRKEVEEIQEFSEGEASNFKFSYPKTQAKCQKLEVVKEEKKEKEKDDSVSLQLHFIGIQIQKQDLMIQKILEKLNSKKSSKHKKQVNVEYEEEYPAEMFQN